MTAHLPCNSFKQIAIEKPFPLVARPVDNNSIIINAILTGDGAIVVGINSTIQGDAGAVELKGLAIIASSEGLVALFAFPRCQHGQLRARQ